MKCRYCGEKMDNPQIFHIHEKNCIEHQKQNGLIEEEEKVEDIVDYATMTTDQLKALCKDNNLEGYTTKNKEDLIKFIQENIK